MNDTNTVETKDEAAVTSQETVDTQTSTQVDYATILAEKDAELTKVRQEKENYKKGLLKAKGKIPEDYQSDTDETETQEAMTRRIVQETMLSTREAQLQIEKDQTISALLKRNKEVETALKNRGQVTSSSGEGSNQDKPEGRKDNYFSNDQITALKAKGYDDKKIELLKKNMTKVNEMPKV